MSKVPRFSVAKSPDGWRVNVPAAVSDTGKRQQRFFTTRRLAEDFSAELREQHRNHGAGVSVLPPRVQDDAYKAWIILEPYGITLAEAAREVVDTRKRAEQSELVSTSLRLWIEEAEGHLRPRTVEGYESTRKKLAALGERVMSTLRADEIGEAIEGGSYSAHRANASAWWHWCADAPRKWCDPAVFADVARMRRKTGKDVEILSLKEVEVLLRTAEKHCPEAVPIYAVAFFGGVREEELSKLDEESVTAEGVDVGSEVAKKRRRRYVPMNDTLKAWLDAYPFAPCVDWRRRHITVRRTAGWDVSMWWVKDQPAATRGTWPHNAIRHTHASLEIAMGATIEDLLFRFGHVGTVDTLRSHYVGKMRRAEAEAILALRPRGRST